MLLNVLVFLNYDYNIVLYILGGSDIFNNLSNVNTVPAHYNAGSAKGGANNDTLFILVGATNILVENKDVYKFDPQNNSWSTPIITGEPPTIIIDASTAVIDRNGRMYLWAGGGLSFYIFDTINLVWTKGSSVGAPNVVNVATLLPDNKIFYIVENDSSQVLIYNTINNIWTSHITSGIIPNKFGMSAVLGLDGQRIIIFGGLDNTITTTIISEGPLYELSLINFEWRIPKTSGPTPEAFRSGHRANVIGNYMVISFGISYITDNDILLLDISNVSEYIWTNEFKTSSSSLVRTSASVPIKPSPSLSSLSPLSPLSPSQKSENNNSNITGIVIGSMIGGALLSFLGVLLYNKCCKRRNGNEIAHPVRLPTESNYNNVRTDNHGQEIPAGNHHNTQPGRIDYHGQEITSTLTESHYNIQPERNDYYPGREIE
ncbi:unnamed protein product [Rhizophagus irregularis]|nr:unnamed protein product [Rhizophagus irregularis]